MQNLVERPRLFGSKNRTRMRFGEKKKKEKNS